MEKKTILLIVCSALIIGIGTAAHLTGSVIAVLPSAIAILVGALLIFFIKGRWGNVSAFLAFFFSSFYLFFFTDHDLSILFGGISLLIPAIYLIFEGKGKKALMFGILLIIIAGSIIPYYNAPKGYFIWDDINLILMDYQIKSWNFLPKVFSRDFFGFSDNARKYGYYRPVVTITYMFDWQLWGTKPGGYHWTNIWFHVLNSLMVFFVLMRFFRKKPLVPLIGTLLFATTPIHTESVTWIAGRTDPICSLLFFMAFYFYMLFFDNMAVEKKSLLKPEKQAELEELSQEKHSIWILLFVHGIFVIPIILAFYKILPPYVREVAAVFLLLVAFLFIFWKRKRDNGWLLPLVLSLVFYALALFAKEMAFSLPLIIAGYTILRLSDFQWKKFFAAGKRKNLLFYLFAVVFYGFVSIGYVLVRLFWVSFSEQARNPFDFVATVLSFVKTIFLYVWKMLFPV